MEHSWLFRVAVFWVKQSGHLLERATILARCRGGEEAASVNSVVQLRVGQSKSMMSERKPLHARVLVSPDWVRIDNRL